MFLDTRPNDTTTHDAVDDAEALAGAPGSDPTKQGLPHTVLDNDDGSAEDGKLLSASYDYGVGSFTPDVLFENLVERYREAQRLYGPTIIRAITGYDGTYIEKNVKIKEFRDHLRAGIHRNIAALRDRGVLDREGETTSKGVRLAAQALITDELDRLATHGIGRHERERDVHGDRTARIPYAKQRYRDVDVRGSVHRALRRGHANVVPGDLVASERAQHRKVEIVYALDASGSMRGKKLGMAKRAGIALFYRAIEDGNAAGLVVFASTVVRAHPPGQRLAEIAESLVTVRAGQETDLALAVRESARLFSARGTRHLVLLTDVVPTKGDNPYEAVREAVATARAAGITVSVVGIGLEREGATLAQQLSDLGCGRFYVVRDVEDLDLVMLEEYAHVRAE